MYVQVRDGILILFIVTKVFGCRGRHLQCRQVKCTKVKSQKLTTEVRLESTINAVIRRHSCSPKCKVVLGFVVGPSWGPAKFVHGTYSACKALAVSPQNPCGVRSLLPGPRSILAGVWNYLWPVLY